MNVHESCEEDPLENGERDRSNFVRELVQRTSEPARVPARHLPPPPKRIVQFWDDLGRLPQDVGECMESWKKLERSGFEFQVFDESSAREFIRIHLGSRYAKAFDKCYHPSMKSDYFRYSYIFVEGGFYVDADDVYHGTTIDHLFTDGRLKLQPFCYDIATAQMVPPSVFVNSGAHQSSWIFYFNTTPLIAVRNHPIVERALLNATTSLEQESKGGLPEVQATTAPATSPDPYPKWLLMEAARRKCCSLCTIGKKLPPASGHSVTEVIRETGGFRISKRIGPNGTGRSYELCAPSTSSCQSTFSILADSSEALAEAEVSNIRCPRTGERPWN